MGLRILIVEDDKHIRKILEQLLTREPSLAARAPEVVLAQDGKEGIEALDKGPYDLVISDLLMPRVDGFAFTAALRKHKHGEKVPLIVTSAIYKDAATISRLQAETGAQFFSKPFQIKDILTAIKRTLDAPPPQVVVSATRPARRDATPTSQRKSAPAQPVSGNLADRQPPRLMLELYEQRASGLLTLQRGKVKKDISLVHGSPVAVTSNLRTETLGHFLVARGVLDESRHQQALKRAQESHDRLGHALVELGWLTDAELMKQLGAQMRAKITNVLRWRDGDWLFVPGAPPPTSLPTPVEAPRVIFGGLSKTAHVDEIAQTLALVRGRIALTQRAERHREPFVRIFGDGGLAALQRRPLLEELLVGADPTPMLVQLDALLACGMAEIEPMAVDKKPPHEETDPIALERLPVADAAPAGATDRTLYDELFGDEPSIANGAPPEGLTPPADEDDEISGVMQVPRVERPRTSTAPGASPASAGGPHAAAGGPHAAGSSSAAASPAAPAPSAASHLASPSAPATASSPAAARAAGAAKPSGSYAVPAGARAPNAAKPSGSYAIPSTGHASAPPARAPTEADALRAEVLREYLAIQGKDHYQVLHLARGARIEEISNAYEELSRRFSLERFADVDLGKDYARVEEIYQMRRNAYETLASPAARSAYDAELDRRDRPQHPSTKAFDADLLAQQALARLAVGDASGARALIERAVTAAPEQADYHALLGWTVFHANGRSQAAAAAAWAHLHAAFDIDRDHVDAHEFAGRISLAAQDDERALEHLGRVLDADPARAEALGAYEAACNRRNEPKRLERQYRKLIHRLGAGADGPGRALPLWWKLAELYRGALADPASAKVAYETVARLSPDDPRPREALAQLYVADPRAWRKAAQALRDSWRLAPDDPDPGRALFRLHHEGERWDAAFAVAAALAVRGAGDDVSGSYLRRHRPRFLVRAQQPLDGAAAGEPAWLDAVRHPDDDRDLSQLLAHIFAVWQPPSDLAALGVTSEDAIDAMLLPSPFARALGYAAHQLGVAAPPVYRRADFAGDAQVGAARPPILLAGPQALALADLTALVFRLGRALTYVWPGRAAARALPSRQLKTALLAALTLATPSLRIDDGDGEIARVRGQLAAVSPGLAREVAPLCERILGGAQATLNLARYIRGLGRTADRVGLLLCNDLAAAVRIVLGDGAGAENDLIDFALGDDYLAARDALGLAVAV